MNRRRPWGRAALALLAGLVLTACDRGEPEEPRGSLFIREAPEFTPPIRPAPDLADIRPAPDLDADRKALLMICAAQRVGNQDTCSCLASEATRRFRGRDLAYFAARTLQDAAEAARLELGMTPERRAARVRDSGEIIQDCGVMETQ